MGSIGANKNTPNTGNTVLMKTVQDYMQNNMSVGTQYSKVTSAEIVGPVDENGMANVRVEYENTVRVLSGYDAELQREI